METLALTIDGIRYPNPFVIASGPPSTNERVIAKAFEEGWGGVVAKTVCLDGDSIKNVSPRYGKLTSRETGEVIGFENIELISDRSFESWLGEFERLKRAFPDRVLIASVMESFDRARWHEIIRRCEATGVDAFELNLSCPHGLPERRMGSAMGQDPALIEQVSRWVREATAKPVYAKLTPNITNIAEAAAAARRGGCTGVTAINTILCVIGVDLDTLRPMPTVEGYSTPGGYSSQAVRPIALRMVSEIALHNPGCTINAVGGVERATDAVQFLLLGGHTIQVCTGAMLHGYGIVRELCEGTVAFMQRHGFKSLDEFRGRSLAYFDTHAGLVQRQRAAKRARAGEAGLDDRWDRENLRAVTSELTG